MHCSARAHYWYCGMLCALLKTAHFDQLSSERVSRKFTHCSNLLLCHSKHTANLILCFALLPCTMDYFKAHFVIMHSSLIYKFTNGCSLSYVKFKVDVQGTLIRQRRTKSFCVLCVFHAQMKREE